MEFIAKFAYPYTTHAYMVWSQKFRLTSNRIRNQSFWNRSGFVV